MIAAGRRGRSTCRCRAGLALGASELARYRCVPHAFPTGATVDALHGRPRRAPRPVDRRRPRAAARRSARARATSRRCATALVDELVPAAPADDIAIIAAPASRPSASGSAAPGRPTRRRSPTSAAAAPLAARARRDRGRGLRHHVAVPGGVRERGRARVRSGRRTFELEATCSDGRVTVTVRDHGQLAPAARREPRPRAAAHAGADGACRRASTPTKGTVVVLERALGQATAA